MLVDEDSQSRILVKLLRNAGHDVMTVNEAGLSGQPDSEVFNYARQEGRLVLTQNYDDFQQLHKAHPEHPGILVVYKDADESKNMSYKAIVKAIANLEALEAVMTSLTNQFISLNRWNY
jgi:predicted nuclease of predicted toxin-antitoxin system